MYKSTKSKAGRRSTRLELKNEAFCDRGKRQGDQERKEQRQQPQTANHRRGPQAQRAELGGPEGPETGDDGDGDVGQHHHLEQLDEPVGHPLERRRPLAQEQPGEKATGEAGEDSVERASLSCRSGQQEGDRHGHDCGCENPSSITVIPREHSRYTVVITTGRVECLIFGGTCASRARW